MRRLLTIMLLAGVLVAIPAGTASAKPERVDVCHLDELGAWQLRSVPAVGRAVDAHLRHGDALPGETVPGMTSYTFDESCTPIIEELTETVFAVAYTDVDPSDGGYNAAKDVLIAKLIDGPGEAGDGYIGVGDLVITNRYPLVLAGDFTYGDFNVTTHTVTNVTVVGAEFISVLVGGANFKWFNRSDGEGYNEDFNGSAGIGATSIVDASSDLIIAQPPGPSQASTAVSAKQVRVGDDTFIDVEFNLP
jgi:hypothetical protein